MAARLSRVHKALLAELEAGAMLVEGDDNDVLLESADDRTMPAPLFDGQPVGVLLAGLKRAGKVEPQAVEGGRAWVAKGSEAGDAKRGKLSLEVMMEIAKRPVPVKEQATLAGVKLSTWLVVRRTLSMAGVALYRSGRRDAGDYRKGVTRKASSNPSMRTAFKQAGIRLGSLVTVKATDGRVTITAAKS